MKVEVKTSHSENFIAFFDHARRRPGDVLSIPDMPRRALFPKEQKLVEGNDEAKAIYEQIKDKDGKIAAAFSFRWMIPVDASTPDKVSTAPEALKQRTDEIKLEKAAAKPGLMAAAAGGNRGDVL